MIFIRYLTKNILVSFLATTMVLVVILISNLAVRLLTDVIEDGIYGGYIFKLIFFNLLDDLPLLLPLCLLIGVFLGLSKLHKNNEWLAMRALGVGFKQQLQSIFLISIPIGIIISVLSLYLSPISMNLIHIYRNEYDISNQLKSLIAQNFALSNNSKHVIYVDENNQILANQTGNDIYPMKGIFIYSQLAKKQERIIVAEKAKQNTKTINGIESSFFILSNGEIYTFEKDELVELMQFKRYDMVIENTQSNLQTDDSVYSVPSLNLFLSTDKRENSEFFWRLSAPIMLIFSSLLALYFASFKPREHSFKKLFLALFLYIIYHNTLNSARYLAVSLPISAGSLFFAIHFFAFILVIFGFLIQKGYFKGLVK